MIPGRISGKSALPLDDIPEVRDGLTRKERVVLTVLAETQRERGDRSVPTAMLYGRVVDTWRRDRPPAVPDQRPGTATLSRIPRTAPTYTDLSVTYSVTTCRSN